jgi:hypothetical protein
LSPSSLVAGLGHGLQRHPVGGGAGGDAHGVADGAASELQDAVLPEVVEKLVEVLRGDAQVLQPQGLGALKPNTLPMIEDDMLAMEPSWNRSMS